MPSGKGPLLALQKADLVRNSSGLVLYEDGSSTANWVQDPTYTPSSFYSDGDHIIINPGSQGYITQAKTGVAKPFIFEARVKWNTNWTKTRIFVWKTLGSKWWNGSRIYDGGDDYRHEWRATNDNYDSNSQTQGYSVDTWYRLRLELHSATSATGYVLDDNHTTLKSHGPQTIKSQPNNIKFVIGGGYANTQRWDWVKVWKNNTIPVSGMPTGWKVKLRKTSDDSLVAQATESGGTASLDVSSLDPDGYPLDGYFEILDSGDVVQFTSDSFTDIWGGDEYEYVYSANNITFVHSDFSYQSEYDDVKHQIKVSNQTEFKIVGIPRNWSYHSITPSSGVTVTCHMDQCAQEVEFTGCTPATEYTIEFRENIHTKPVGWNDDSFTDGWFEVGEGTASHSATHDHIILTSTATGYKGYRNDNLAVVNIAVYKYLVIGVTEVTGGTWSAYLYTSETETWETMFSGMTSTGWHVKELDVSKRYSKIHLRADQGEVTVKYDFVRFTRGLEPFKGPFAYEGRVIVKLNPVEDVITAECTSYCNKVGDFKITVDNSDGAYTGLFSAGDEVELMGGPLLSLLGWGRVEDIQEKNGVLELSGRNEMVQLLGLSATKTYTSKDLTAIAKDLLASFTKVVATIHENDFEDNVDEWTALGGSSWSCANGYYSSTDNTEVGETVVNDTDDTEDIVLSCSVKWDNSGAPTRCAGIVFHYKTSTTYRYYARLCDQYGYAYELYKYDGSWTLLGAAGVPADLVNGQWYDLEVRMEGNNIQFWVDGDKKIEVDDSSAIASGRHGLYHSHVATDFDDWVAKKPYALVSEGKMIDAEVTLDKHIVRHAWLLTELQKLGDMANYLFRMRRRHIGELSYTMDFFPSDYIDPDNRYTFVWDNGDIADYEFPNLGRQLYNSIIVRGGINPSGATVEAKAEDEASISQYGYYRKRIFDSSIKTSSAAQKRADAELSKYKQPVGLAKITTFDAVTCLEVGEVIHVTVPEKDLDAEPYTVIGTKHTIFPFTSEIRAIATGSPISESFSDFFGDTLRNLDEASSRVVDAELCDISCQTCSQKTGECQTACQTECQSACETSCKGCGQTVCESGCEAGCLECDETGCETSCKKSEKTGCSGTCDRQCQGTCDQQCQGCGQTSCEESCKASCKTCSEAPCMDKCETKCQMSCEPGISCEAKCETSCQYCAAEGGPFHNY